MTVGQPHLFDDAVVVFRTHEPVERTESASGEQFEIAKRALRKTHSWVKFWRVQECPRRLAQAESSGQVQICLLSMCFWCLFVANHLFWLIYVTDVWNRRNRSKRRKTG